MKTTNVKLLFYCMLICTAGWSQAKAYTLLVGLSEIDEKAYRDNHGWTFDMEGTSGVRKDIDKMSGIFLAESHQCTVLENKKATRKAILAAMDAIGKKVKPGDMFTLYFSGHGYFLPDDGTDEASGLDQVLIAYDDLVRDDEIYEKFQAYFTATKNIMIVDACHSSTSYKILTENHRGSSIWPQALSVRRQGKLANKAVNTSAIACRPETLSPIAEPFNLIYFGAVEDSGEAGGDSNGGIMTIALAAVVKKARQVGNWTQYDYRRLACELSYAMAGQPLQYHEIGKSVLQYVTKVPFKIQ